MCASSQFCLVGLPFNRAFLIITGDLQGCLRKNVTYQTSSQYTYSVLHGLPNDPQKGVVAFLDRRIPTGNLFQPPQAIPGEHLRIRKLLYNSSKKSESQLVDFTMGLLVSPSVVVDYCASSSGPNAVPTVFIRIYIPPRKSVDLIRAGSVLSVFVVIVKHIIIEDFLAGNVDYSRSAFHSNIYKVFISSYRQIESLFSPSISNHHDALDAWRPVQHCLPAQGLDQGSLGNEVEVLRMLISLCHTLYM